MSNYFDEIRKLLDKEESARRQLSDCRQMIMGAHVILNKIRDEMPKNVSAKLLKEFHRLREQLTYPTEQKGE